MLEDDFKTLSAIRYTNAGQKVALQLHTFRFKFEEEVYAFLSFDENWAAELISLINSDDEEEKASALEFFARNGTALEWFPFAKGETLQAALERLVNITWTGCRQDNWIDAVIAAQAVFGSFKYPLEQLHPTVQEFVDWWNTVK